MRDWLRRVLRGRGGAGGETWEGGRVTMGKGDRCGVIPPASFPRQDPASVLVLTLDSCRFDTFAAAAAPNLKRIGTLHQAMAPAHFTLASHAALFVGFTPGRADSDEPFVNPKRARIFRLGDAGIRPRDRDFLTLRGRTIMDGLKHLGYRTIGCGAMRWFRPDTASGRVLSFDFDEFFWGGRPWALPAQLEFLGQHLPADGRRVFAFVNIGETHTPYYFEGCGWDGSHNPCVPFGTANDAGECRRRQTACVEYADRLLGPLLAAFADSTIIACGDHGDCWGEDGLWEHTVFHPKVFEVPLLFRLGQKP